MAINVAPLLALLLVGWVAQPFYWLGHCDTVSMQNGYVFPVYAIAPNYTAQAPVPCDTIQSDRASVVNQIPVHVTRNVPLCIFLALWIHSSDALVKLEAGSTIWVGAGYLAWYSIHGIPVHNKVIRWIAMVNQWGPS